MGIFLIGGAILQEIFHRLLHERHDFLRIVNGSFRNPPANLPHEIVRCADADITGKEHHFQVFQKIFVNLCIADDYAFDILYQTLLGLCQALFDFVKKSHIHSSEHAIIYSIVP